MNQEWSPAKRDTLLNRKLQHLSARGLAPKWAASKTPYSDIQRECHLLIANQYFNSAIKEYLNLNPMIQEAFETLLEILAVTSEIKWHDPIPVLHILLRKHWYRERWTPTSLIMDDPLGQIIKDPKSPLNSILREQQMLYPILCEIEEIFKSDFFNLIRDGAGKWSFIWNAREMDKSKVIIDVKKGKTRSITLMEGETLHFVVLSILEVVNTEIFKDRSSRFSI